MKTQIIAAIAACFFTISLIITLSTGCKKYEDGPMISLMSKKERVANHWVVEKAMENNNDVTSSYNRYELLLSKDGDAELDANYTFFGTPYQIKSNGTWNFTKKDENIVFNFSEDSQDSEYQILRLTEKEFWLRKVGAELELHLREK